MNFPKICNKVISYLSKVKSMKKIAVSIIYIGLLFLGLYLIIFSFLAQPFNFDESNIWGLRRILSFTFGFFLFYIGSFGIISQYLFQIKNKSKEIFHKIFPFSDKWIINHKLFVDEKTRVIIFNVLGVIFLLLFNFWLRYYLENANQSMFSNWTYLSGLYPKIAEQFPNVNWLNLFIPNSQFLGYYGPLRMLILFNLVFRWGLSNTWYIFNALVIIGSFLLSWSFFHSRTFSFTLSIILGFGTYLHYTYRFPGSVDTMAFLLIYGILLILAYRVVVEQKNQLLWKSIFILLLILGVLYGEQTIDFLVFFCLACILLIVIFWYRKEKHRLPPLIFLFTTTVIISLLFVFIKFKYAHVTGTQSGWEEELIFTYFPSYVLPAIEDFISNNFTLFYLVISSLLPPFLVGSNSYFSLGPEKLIELQNNFQAKYSYLIPMQHLFLWRFYAGVWFAVFVFILIYCIKRCLRGNYKHYLPITIFTLMSLCASPVHSIIKARPYMSFPLPVYKSLVGVFGISLLLSYCFMLLRNKMRNQTLSSFLIIGFWVYVFYLALVRPEFLYQLGSLVGINIKSALWADPLRTLQQAILGFFAK